MGVDIYAVLRSFRHSAVYPSTHDSSNWRLAALCEAITLFRASLALKRHKFRLSLAQACAGFLYEDRLGKYPA
jgi:hypothetical protein